MQLTDNDRRNYLPIGTAVRLRGDDEWCRITSVHEHRPGEYSYLVTSLDNTEPVSSPWGTHIHWFDERRFAEIRRSMPCLSELDPITEEQAA